MANNACILATHLRHTSTMAILWQLWRTLQMARTFYSFRLDSMEKQRMEKDSDFQPPQNKAKEGRPAAWKVFHKSSKRWQDDHDIERIYSTKYQKRTPIGPWVVFKNGEVQGIKRAQKKASASVQRIFWRILLSKNWITRFYALLPKFETKRENLTPWRQFIRFLQDYKGTCLPRILVLPSFLIRVRHASVKFVALAIPSIGISAQKE